MLKKIIFITTGVLISLGLYACLLPDESPAQAHKAAYWLRNGRMDVEVYYPPQPGGAVELTWKMLSDVTFKQIYVQDLDAYFWKPAFGPQVKALEGKEVFITGYVIPVDYDANFYVVSRWPYANCYFCGGGGPETVADLRFVQLPRRYKTDERLTFKGRLKLNADDVYQMNYILEGAQEYQP